MMIIAKSQKENLVEYSFAILIFSIKRFALSFQKKIKIFYKPAAKKPLYK